MKKILMLIFVSCFAHSNNHLNACGDIALEDIQEQLHDLYDLYEEHGAPLMQQVNVKMHDAHDALVRHLITAIEYGDKKGRELYDEHNEAVRVKVKSFFRKCFDITKTKIDNFVLWATEDEASQHHDLNASIERFNRMCAIIKHRIETEKGFSDEELALLIEFYEELQTCDQDTILYLDIPTSYLNVPAV